MGQIHLRGGGLAALALAARLARQGHQLTLAPEGEIGGRAARQVLAGSDGVVVDDLPPVSTLPAAWRDLAKKSGRPMAGFLNAAHLSLVEAPAARHHFPDGSEVALPADRGGQVAALQRLCGRPAALAWADLLDDVDQVWQALRRHGVERPHHPDHPVPASLWPELTMAELAQRLPDPRLRMLLLSSASRAGATTAPGAPALLASRWSLERTFGRWQLLDQEAGHARPWSDLTGRLVERVNTAGVTVVDGSDAGQDAAVVVDCTTPPPPLEAPQATSPSQVDRIRWSRWAGLTRRVTRAGTAAPLTWARPPAIGHTVESSPDRVTPGVHEVVHHHDDGRPVVRWSRAIGSGRLLVTVHDHRRPAAPDGQWGWTIDSFAHWQQRPPLRRAVPPGGEPVGGPAPAWQVSAASHAGNEPWAELLSAALVAYEVHEHLTGEDIRPTNRLAPRPPRR